MNTRSKQMEIRNPIVGLASYQRLLDLPPEAQEALQAVLHDLAIDAAARAEQSWAKSKGPMAAYWKAVSVYAKHIRAAVRHSKSQKDLFG